MKSLFLCLLLLINNLLSTSNATENRIAGNKRIRSTVKSDQNISFGESWRNSPSWSGKLITHLKLPSLPIPLRLLFTWLFYDAIIIIQYHSSVENSTFLSCQPFSTRQLIYFHILLSIQLLWLYHLNTNLRSLSNFFISYFVRYSKAALFSRVIYLHRFHLFNDFVSYLPTYLTSL